MIKHVVLFKFKNPSLENIAKAKDSLLGMQGKIDELEYIEVGVDFLHSERSYDLILITHFQDEKALDIYRSHAIHQPVIETMRELCENSVVVDYQY